MTDERWIVVRNWDRFQHYPDRDPTWIKNYVRLLHDDGYLSLSGHQRAVLHGLWLAYASSDGQLRLSTLSLTRQLGLRVSSRQLESLSDAGFIAFAASKPLSLARSREKRREETPISPSREKPRGPRKTGWRLVRGSHGQTTIPDPNGTDPAPTIGRTL